MSVEVIESFDSRSLQGDANAPRGTLRFSVYGTDDDADAAVALLLAAPIFFRGIPRMTYTLDPVGGGFWKAAVIYTVPDGNTLDDDGDAEPEDDDSELGVGWSFDTTGGQQHITSSLQTIWYDARVDPGGGGPEAINHKQAIGVTRESVEGTDIVSPVLTFSRKVKFSVMTIGYVKVLRGLTGTVNASAYLGFAARELLFMGFTSDYQGPQGWSVEFKFGAAPTLTDIVIVPASDPLDPEDGLVVPTKAGWDYLWVEYEPSAAQDSPATIPRAAYVERVYRATNFALLGI